MNRLFINGNIVTMDPHNPNASAMIVQEERFSFVGDDVTALKQGKNQFEVIDLKGRTVIPGLIDSHMHVLSLGMFLRDVQLDKALSIEDVILTTKKYITQNKIPPGTWVRGRGWNQDSFKSNHRFLNRYDLDKISTEHPIAFTRSCGHIVAANSYAITLADIKEVDIQKDGGQVDLDENGEVLGIFREAARNIIWDVIPVPTLMELKSLILLATKEALRHGVTSVHTDDFKDVPQDYELVIKAYMDLLKNKELKVKVYEQCNLPSIVKLKDFFGKGYYSGWGDEYYKLGPLKLLTDGSFGAKTAYISEPYLNESSKGIQIINQDELDVLIQYAHQKNMHVAIHAIGDQTIENVIHSIEKAQLKYPKPEIRHGIIHCSLTNDHLLNKFRSLNIMAYVQPIFINSDLHLLESLLGHQRSKKCYTFKTMLDKGIHLTFGSDCPVESINVMHGIYSAVTRKDLRRYPQDGWNSLEKTTVKQALQGFTLNGAYASYEEDTKGSISVGKFADFVVIDGNIFDIDYDLIKDISVIETFVNGRCEYSANI